MVRSAGSLDGRAQRVAAAVGIGLAVASAVCAARSVGWLSGAELSAYDRLVARRSEPHASERVAVVHIREQEIAEYGHPLPDEVLVRALDGIAVQGPSAIGIDLYREPPRAGDPVDGWRRLADRFRGPVPIVAIEKRAQPGDPGVRAPDFAAADQVGFSDFVLDDDGVVRRGLLFMWDEADEVSLSFSLQLALHALEPHGKTVGADPRDPARVRLGEVPIPPLEASFGAYVSADAAGYQFPLDFATPADAIPGHSLSDVLGGRLPDGALRGRVVLLGTTSRSVKDDLVTARSRGALVHGVDLHAQATDQFLRIALDGERPLRDWSDPAEWVWIFAWSLAGALGVLAAPHPLASLAVIAALLASLLGLAGAAFAAGLWLPWLPPSIATLGSGGGVLAELARRQRGERRAMMDLFGRFVSRSVADELWRQRGAFMRGGRPQPRRLVITSMLTDLKGFTGAAEAMDPVALMDWVGEYMGAMTRVVEVHGGLVDDYTGDGIKANFGVPLAADASRVAEDARRAVRCAIAMGRELEALAEGWRARGLPTVSMRIGLYTGQAVGGTIGSVERMKYTTVGDTVNTAARLESFHKEEVARPSRDGRVPLFRILIGDSTRAHLGEDEFEIEDLGVYALRGRAEPVRIHRVFGLRSASGGSP